jgi:hypothetical protein
MPRKQETPHLRVRIEPRLLARLEKAREKSGRTLTGEIVSRIESSFRRDEHEDIIAAIKETIASHGAAVVIDPDIKPEGEDKS